MPAGRVVPCRCWIIKNRHWVCQFIKIPYLYTSPLFVVWFLLMEQNFKLIQSQKMALSPQIRQYLKLLQVPRAELEQTIEAELAENPLLEEIQKTPAEEAPGSEPAAAPEAQSPEIRVGETFETFDRMDENFRGQWADEDLSAASPEDARKRKDYQENLLTRPETLADFLTWQAGLLDWSADELKAVEEIIGNINEDGYLTAELSEISSAAGVPAEMAAHVLGRIQKLEPPGIGAKNLQEALLFQLERKGPEAALAHAIVAHHLTLLEKRDFKQLARIFQTDAGKIQEAVAIIVRLEPKPGRLYYAETAAAVTPDGAIFFSEDDPEKLKVDIYDEATPSLRINAYYRRLLRSKDTDEKTKAYVREKLQSAVNFIKALQLRKSTLRAITEEIAKVQAEFFKKGFAHMVPLRLKDIANTLNIHESTVSRALQAKYVITPQGTLPYKSFFSTRLETTSGEAESQTSIIEQIRTLISQENAEAPFSDQEIVAKLHERGIRIARRTVAKYREMLKILPSHLRKKR